MLSRAKSPRKKTRSKARPFEPALVSGRVSVKPLAVMSQPHYADLLLYFSFIYTIRDVYLSFVALEKMAGSSKEITAMIVNLKERRILDKSVQTLSLEESYASKLLDLDRNMLRFHYTRLKSNVNKIRTHLKPEDIAAMRTLELEGKFKPEHPVVCTGSSAGKIAAAGRRLKLGSYNKRAVSAMPRLSHAKQANQHEESDTTTTDEPLFSCSKKPIRPKTTDCKSPRSSSDDTQSVSTPRPKTSFLLDRITRAQKERRRHTPHTSYSCHEEKQDDGGTKKGLDIFGPNPYEERRARFLAGETKSFQNLGNRKETFVHQINQFVRENPLVTDVRPEATKEIIQSIDSMAARAGTSHSVLPNNKDATLMKQLAELRKTRYLRLDDDKLDHSGSETLARTFLKRTSEWRNFTAKPRKSFRQQAEICD